jgi:hypothetical protein
LNLDELKELITDAGFNKRKVSYPILSYPILLILKAAMNCLKEKLRKDLPKVERI